LELAALRNDQKAICALVKQYGADVNTKDEYDNTSLYNAGLSEKFEKLKCLIDCRANVNMQCNGDIGEMPLYLALSKEDFEIVKYLRDNGANVDAKNWLGWTSLHGSASKRNFDMGKCLIDCGANVNAND
jgi:ankyrin repeat protein